MRAELADVRHQYNTIRLHAGIGYVTPADEHDGATLLADGRGEPRARDQPLRGADVFPDGAGTVEFVVSTRVRDDREQVSCRGMDLNGAADPIATGVHGSDGNCVCS